MPLAPFLEKSYFETTREHDGGPQRSALQLSWNRSGTPNREGRTRSRLERGGALSLLRRQLHLLETEIVHLPYGSELAADWETETEWILRELLEETRIGMHPNVYRFKYPVAEAALPAQPWDWELQEHYEALLGKRRQLLREVLGGVEREKSSGPLVAAGCGTSMRAGCNTDQQLDRAAVPQAVHTPISFAAKEPKSAATHVDTFLFSDLHLGSDVSRCKELMQVLQSYRFKRLILLGDIFDDLNFKRLRRDHWEMLSWLRKLSNPDRMVDIIWILGNHDLLLENVSHFVGIEVRDKYTWQHRGKRFLAIHGHQFDRFLEKNVLISDIATTLYILAQKLDTRRQRFSRLLKRLSKKWLRLSNQVALRAAQYARMQGVDYVFCGHTHRAVALEIEGVGYFNTGCWTDMPSHFITIDSENRIALHAQE